MKNPNPVARPNLPDMVDPSKLALPDGAFQVGGKPVPQISPKQLGPFAHGVALMSMEEASPYLKAGRGVSSEPLAIAVFCPGGQTISTVLPHTKVMIPCGLHCQ